jgi:hypothetical protein
VCLCAHCNDCTGRIRLRKDPEDEPPINLLAPDPLTDPPTVETLTAALKRISAPVKVLYSMHCASTVKLILYVLLVFYRLRLRLSMMCS